MIEWRHSALRYGLAFRGFVSSVGSVMPSAEGRADTQRLDCGEEKAEQDLLWPSM
jgi:hypothetical protein